MASENALAFLSQLEAGKALLPAAILIAGPQAFLKEYVLDACRNALRGPGRESQSFHIGSGGDLGAVLEAVSAPSLFAPAVVATCRILRSRGGGDDDSGEAAESRGSRGSDDSTLSRAIELVRSPSHLILIYERDNAPVKVQRQVEKAGLGVICTKPFESHLTQFAALFAHRLGLKISYATVDTLTERYGTNLAAMHNALVLAAIAAAEQRPDDFLRSSAGVVDLGAELFQISESLSGDLPLVTFAMIDRAVAIGRDPTELLMLEIIPALRRLLIAATLTMQGQGSAEIAMEISMSPRSPRVTATISAARRYGLRRLTKAYREAIDLDASFKNGTVKEREQALSGLLAPLLMDDSRPAGGR
ncbi:MAG: DNA polymerase III subunit delta [Candidatus Binataceae bacterium]